MIPTPRAVRPRPARGSLSLLFAAACAASLLLAGRDAATAAPAGGAAKSKKAPSATAPGKAGAKPKAAAAEKVARGSTAAGRGGASKPAPPSRPSKGRAARTAVEGDAPRPSPTPVPPREISVTGELVETGCFFVGGRRGPHHRACAMGCARVGQPVAILDDSGVLRIAILDHRSETPENPLIEHLGRRVELGGTAVERGGVSGILVRSVRPLSAPRQEN